MRFVTFDCSVDAKSQFHCNHNEWIALQMCTQHTLYVRSYVSFSSIITVQYAPKQTRYHMMSAFFFMHIIFISIRSFHSIHPLFLLFSYILKTVCCRWLSLGFVVYPISSNPSSVDQQWNEPTADSILMRMNIRRIEWIFLLLNRKQFPWNWLACVWCGDGDVASRTHWPQQNSIIHSN